MKTLRAAVILFFVAFAACVAFGVSRPADARFPVTSARGVAASRTGATPNPTPTILISDTFTDTAGQQLRAHTISPTSQGTSWIVRAINGADGAVKLDGSGNMYCDATTTTTDSIVDAKTATAGVKATVTIVGAAPDAGLMARFSGSDQAGTSFSAQSGLLCHFSATVVDTYYYTGPGNYTAMGSTSYSMQAGDVVSCTASDPDGSHSQIVLAVNGTTKLTSSTLNSNGSTWPFNGNHSYGFYMANGSCATVGTTTEWNTFVVTQN